MKYFTTEQRSKLIDIAIFLEKNNLGINYDFGQELDTQIFEIKNLLTVSGAELTKFYENNLTSIVLRDGNKLKIKILA